MTENRKLFLIGPMGSGKSAVGRRLAGILGLSFYDSDDEIEARTGVDISYIFEKEGESGFRKRESVVIAEIAMLDGIVQMILYYGVSSTVYGHCRWAALRLTQRK